MPQNEEGRRGADAGAGAAAADPARVHKCICCSTKVHYASVTVAMFMNFFADLCKGPNHEREYAGRSPEQPDTWSKKADHSRQYGHPVALWQRITSFTQLSKGRSSIRCTTLPTNAATYQVCITPPDHPVLQVIEKIWAAIKTCTAQHPTATQKDMQRSVKKSHAMNVNNRLWRQVC